MSLTKNSEFDLWIRMSADNKINESNTWNFDLIDYFYDLSSIKVGEKVNFIRASTTLDSCIKIYSSRVDSAATETNRLLNGLAVARQLEYASLLETRDEQSSAEVEPKKLLTGISKRKRSTLVCSASDLKYKKIETELQIDPIFKKAVADFDGGGSSNLLLNILNINQVGGCFFESLESNFGALQMSEIADTATSSQSNINIHKLKVDFLSDLKEIDKCSICPSLVSLSNAIERGSIHSSFMKGILVGPVELTSTRGLEQNNSIFFDNDIEDYFNQTDGLDNDDINETMNKLFGDTGQEEVETEAVLDNVPDYALMSYFDKNFNVNCFTGNEHWKISSFKNRQNIAYQNPIRKRELSTNEKESIDFFDINGDDEDIIFATSETRIDIPKNRKTKNGKHKLPEDSLFNSKRLISLFTKQGSQLKTFNKRKMHNDNKDCKVIFDDYEVGHTTLDQVVREDMQELQMSYDFSYFQDNLHGPDNEISKEVEEVKSNRGSSLQSLISFNGKEPMHINLARSGQRIDVRKLKEDMKHILITYLKQKNTNIMDQESIVLHDVIKRVQNFYKADDAKIPSYSICFVCLLHLSNEYQLSLEQNTNNILISSRGLEKISQ